MRKDKKFGVLPESLEDLAKLSKKPSYLKRMRKLKGKGMKK